MSRVAWQRFGAAWGIRVPKPEPPGWSLVTFSMSQDWAGSPAFTSTRFSCVTVLPLTSTPEYELRFHAADYFRACGVELAGGERIAADIVVSNADTSWTYRHLVAPEHRRHWTDRRIERVLTRP